MIFKVHGVMMAKHLAIDFPWILIDLGGRSGAKLGSNIDQKSIRKISVKKTHTHQHQRKSPKHLS